MVEESEEPEWDEPATERHVAAGNGLVPARDALARVALATIRDVGAEVSRLVRDAATRVTRGTPMAPLVHALVGNGGPENGVDGETWAARVADAEQAVAIGVQRASALEDRYELALVELREARSRERALHADLDATLERSAAEREAISRRADELVADAEAQRATAARDAEVARTALSTAQQASLAQRNELSLARSEVARLGAACEEAQHARDTTEREAQAFRTRLAESQERIRVLEVELARIGEARRRAERMTLGEQAEREARWQDELSSLRLEHARERDRAQALTEEIERCRVEAETRERREQRLQDELRAVATRTDADREDTLRRAQEMVQAAEQARATACSELEAIRAAVSTDRARLLQIEAEHEKVEQGVAERDAELASAHAVIAGLEATRSAAVADFERARAQLTETAHELLQTQHEYGVARRQLDKLCTAHDDLVEDHARVSTFLQEARATETALRAQTDELRQQICALETERTRLATFERRQDEVAATPDVPAERTSELETEVTSLRAWSHTLENEVAQAAAAIEQAEARERRLKEALAASEASLREQEATLREAQVLAQAAEGERANAITELENVRTAMASAQRVILEAEEGTRVARTEAERLAVAHEATLAEKERLAAANGKAPAPAADPAAPRSAPATAAPVVLTPPDTRVIAVLDTMAAWPTTGGVDVHMIAPGEEKEIVGRLGELGAGRCIVNLAAAGAIAAAATLRAAGVAVPLWGTIVVPTGERGLMLGPIEVLTRPIDPDIVRSQCSTIAPKNARMLAIGSDSSTFIALRQGLIKAGMSVSIAWDLKQATELLEIVRPHMVMLDLALPGRGAAALLVDLARLETPPVVALLPGATEHMATFSSALATLVPTDGARTHLNVLRAVIDAKRARS